MINKMVVEKRILSFSHPTNAPIVSHLLYADNVVVFANSSKHSIQCLMDLVKEYEVWTGQLVNHEKSAIFSSKDMPYC